MDVADTVMVFVSSTVGDKVGVRVLLLVIDNDGDNDKECDSVGNRLDVALSSSLGLNETDAERSSVGSSDKESVEEGDNDTSLDIVALWVVSSDAVTVADCVVEGVSESVMLRSNVNELLLVTVNESIEIVWSPVAVIVVVSVLVRETENVSVTLPPRERETVSN